MADNLTDPIKVAFGRYLGHFFREVLVADTPALAEFAGRPFAKACVWAPDRMVDQVEEMLDQYRKNDTSGVKQPNTALPVMVAAMAKDFTPSGPEYGRNVADAINVRIPIDPLKRLFKLRVSSSDHRVQVAVIAPDSPTARSLATQLHLYMSALENRTFYTSYRLAGFDEPWPCQLELPDILAVSTPTDVKNLTLLAIDVSFRASVPFLKAPRSTEANDGKGSGNMDDPFAPGYNPSGYQTVQEALGVQFPAELPTADDPGDGRTWRVAVDD